MHNALYRVYCTAACSTHLTLSGSLRYIFIPHSAAAEWPRTRHVRFWCNLLHLHLCCELVGASAMVTAHVSARHKLFLFACLAAVFWKH
jgi:hypothetical protein